MALSQSRTHTNDPTALTQTFNYKSKSHAYSIKWTSLGSLSSPPLIFIHGTPWSSRVWSPIAVSLSSKLHVYLFDNPGFGDSPIERALPGSWSPQSEVEELDADLARQTEVFAALFKFWESKDDEGWVGRNPHIVAHDHAGLMSLRAFLLHECRYASLCLIDVVAIKPPSGESHELFQTVGKHPEYITSLPDLYIDGILESYIRHAAYTKLSDEVVDMLKKPWLRNNGKEEFVRQLRQAYSRSMEDIEGRYSEVGKQVPVKIIWGEEDQWIDAETAERLGKALGAKEVVTIDRAGHLIMYDQPAQLGVELGMWLEGMR